MYVRMHGQHFQRNLGSTGYIANPARGQLNREHVFLPSPFAPETLVSRDRFGRPVPRQPANSPGK